MTVTHGNSQLYLGMNINIKNKKVQMEMKEYLLYCINNFPESITTAAKTLATKSLTKIDVDSKQLDKYYLEIFHSIVQKCYT